MVEDGQRSHSSRAESSVCFFQKRKGRESEEEVGKDRQRRKDSTFRSYLLYTPVQTARAVSEQQAQGCSPRVGEPGAATKQAGPCPRGQGAPHSV